MFFEIPTLRDGNTSDYVQTTALEGVDYTLRFSYNSRDSHWYLTIRRTDDLPIRGCESIKLVANTRLLSLITDPKAPPGEMIVFSSKKGEPGFQDIGGDFTLIYATSDELA